MVRRAAEQGLSTPRSALRRCTSRVAAFRSTLRLGALVSAAGSAGHAGAQNALAGMYETGSGVEPDPDLAAHWYREAAKHGNAEARAKVEALGPEEGAAQ